MNFSNFSIRRPIFAGVLSSIIFIVGLLAMWRLPISEYPEVVPPTIVVRANYPGANPKTIAETVASPLERWDDMLTVLAEQYGASAFGPVAGRAFGFLTALIVHRFVSCRRRRADSLD